MALFKDNDTIPPPQAPRPSTPVADLSARTPPRVETRPEPKESVIAAELSIEGKIQGGGNVRIAGRFKGDVHVDGNVSLEPGSHLEGSVQASSVVISGELTGNIDKAKHVDVTQTGVLVGDLKADSIAVAAGARMRGHVEFGWNEPGTAKLVSNVRSSSQGS